MSRSPLIVCIVVMIIFVCGCTTDEAGPQAQNGIPQTPDEIHGYVLYNGSVVSDARVEATSANGTHQVSTITGADGAYTLKIEPGTIYKVTAMHDGLGHTIWPVSTGRKRYDYDISLTATPRSFIEGTGYSIGGPEGYDNSRPLTGHMFKVTPVNGNDTLTATIQNDWTYSVEVRPGIAYDLEDRLISGPGLSLNYRNGGYVDSSIVVGPNETALIDYVVILP